MSVTRLPKITTPPRALTRTQMDSYLLYGPSSLSRVVPATHLTTPAQQISQAHGSTQDTYVFKSVAKSVASATRSSPRVSYCSARIETTNLATDAQDKDSNFDFVSELPYLQAEDTNDRDDATSIKAKSTGTGDSISLSPVTISTIHFASPVTPQILPVKFEEPSTPIFRIATPMDPSFLMGNNESTYHGTALERYTVLAPLDSAFNEGQVHSRETSNDYWCYSNRDSLRTLPDFPDDAERVRTQLQRFSPSRQSSSSKGFNKVSLFKQKAAGAMKKLFHKVRA